MRLLFLMLMMLGVAGCQTTGFLIRDPAAKVVRYLENNPDFKKEEIKPQVDKWTLTSGVATISRRARNGTPVFSGDRSHIYDRLRDHGWSVRIIALVAAGAQGVLVVIFIGLLVT